jgi:ABC-type antimicrobial peptide transport system permease subunit
VAIGLGASVAVTRVIAHQIWGVSPHDPLTIASVVVVMVTAATAACYVPARRALRVDPMLALRHE